MGPASRTAVSIFPYDAQALLSKTGSWKSDALPVRHHPGCQLPLRRHHQRHWHHLRLLHLPAAPDCQTSSLLHLQVYHPPPAPVLRLHYHLPALMPSHQTSLPRVQLQFEIMLVLWA